MANNSNVIGGFRLDGMHTDLHDGKFELLLIKKFKNPLDFPKLLNAAIIQDYINTDTVDVIETSKAKIILMSLLNGLLMESMVVSIRR